VTESNGSRTILRAHLLTSRLGRYVDVDDPPGAEASFLNSTSIEVLQRREDFNFAFVRFSVGKQINEKPLVDFSALYLLGYRGERFASEDAEYAFLENLIAVVAWPRFCDLCEVIVSQAELDFPRLPERPHSISRPKPKIEE
jgi:hypothetical protein